MPGSYEVDFEGGKARKWPDLIGNISAPLWSEKVVKAFELEGLKGVIFHRMKIRNVESKWLENERFPEYFWAEAISGVPATPFDYMTGESFDRDENTGLFQLMSVGVRRWNFDFSQWDGADLFYISTVFTGHRYCSERFKKLVEDHGFTNFRFTGSVNSEGDEFVTA